MDSLGTENYQTTENDSEQAFLLLWLMRF